MDKLDFDLHKFIKDEKIISNNHQITSLEVSIICKLKEICQAIDKINEDKLNFKLYCDDKFQPFLEEIERLKK